MVRSINQKIKATISILIGILVFSLNPSLVQAAGMSVSGGGTKVVGQNFTITVSASGAEFDALQGVINVSGPVSVVSFVPGGATWLPGKSPSNGNAFVGIVNPTSRVTVATITLKGTKEGKGSVSVGSVKLARNGAYVGTDGGSTSFTIGRAPTPPGSLTVSSSTHPDQSLSYVETIARFSWNAPSNGATGYSYVFNESADTVPEQKVTTTETNATIENIAVGEHYFHVRAQNKDGWSGASHFKIVVKEPDAVIDASLMKPKITEITKTNDFLTDITKGTVSGIKISGIQLISGFTLQAFLEPKKQLPEVLFNPINVDSPLTPMMAVPDAKGNWQLVISQPIPAGFYTLTVQGGKDKTLTPMSEMVRFELTVGQGGAIKVITDTDQKAPIPPTDNSVHVLGMSFSSVRWLYGFIAGILVLMGLVIGVRWAIGRFIAKRRKQKDVGRIQDISDKPMRRSI